MKKSTTLLFAIFLFQLCIGQVFNEIVLLENHYGREAEWGDYDRDGDLDILIFYTLINSTGTPFTRILKNNNGTFEILAFEFPIVENFGSSAAGSANFVDYDNDGLLDVFLTFGQDANVMLYKNEGNDLFTEIQISIDIPTLGSCSTSWIDYDNDGDLDLTIFGYEFNEFLEKEWKVVLFENVLESNQFVNTQIDFGFSRLKSRSPWADFNNDGYMDLLTNELDPVVDTKLCIYKNNGDKTFEKIIYQDIESLNFDPLNQNGDMRWGDYDNDGFVDILFAGRQDAAATKLYRNNGDETFTEIDISNILQMYGNVNLEWGDYNNDGTLDILQTGTHSTSGFSYTTRIYYNINNSFSDSAVETFLDVHQYTMSTAGDFNGDNKLDILNFGKLGVFGSKISLFENISNATNIAPSAPQGLNMELIEDELIFSWSQSLDNQTPLNAITYNISIYDDNKYIVSPNSLESGKRIVSGMGNTGHINTYRLKIPEDGNYYWKVQAIDNSYVGSVFSNELQFTINNNTLSMVNFEREKILVSPNPVDNKLTISNNIGLLIDYIKVYDIKGRIIKKIKLSEPTAMITIDMSQLFSGLYIIEIKGTDGIQMKKFIKK